MFNVLLTKILKKRILNKFEMSLVKLNSSKLIIIVFLSAKISHIDGKTHVNEFADMSQLLQELLCRLTGG